MKMLQIQPLNWWIIIIFSWVYLIHVSQVEGKIFPVAERITITKMKKTIYRYPVVYKDQKKQKGNYTAFWIKSKRLRPECGPKRLEWFLGKRNYKRAGAKIDVFWGPPENHPDGVFHSGPWIAHIEYERFNNTYGDVIHDCVTLGLFHREVRTEIFN